MMLVDRSYEIGMRVEPEEARCLQVAVNMFRLIGEGRASILGWKMHRLSTLLED